MAGEISGAVLACGPVFRGSLRHTLTALGDHADPQGRCYPSIKTIGWSAGVSTRQVKRDIAEAERLGLVSVERRRGKAVNHYRISVTTLQAIAERLRAEKRLQEQRGGNWFERCSELAAQMRDALFDDPDSFSPICFKGDRVSPQNDDREGDRVSPQRGQGVPTEKENGADVPFKGTSGVPFKGTSDGPQTVNNRQEPSPGAAREPQPTLPPNGRMASKQGRASSDAIDDDQAREAVAQCREALTTIHQLATALGMQQHAVCLAVGSVSQAERLALQWATGELTIEQIRCRIDEARRSCGVDDDAEQAGASASGSKNL